MKRVPTAMNGRWLHSFTQTGNDIMNRHDRVRHATYLSGIRFAKQIDCVSNVSGLFIKSFPYPRFEIFTRRGKFINRDRPVANPLGNFLDK